MDQFLTDRNRAFWIFQGCGWTGYFLLRITNSVVSQQIGAGYVLFFLIAMTSGLILTSFVRYGYRIIRTWPILYALAISVVVCIFLGMIISTVELYFLPYLVSGIDPYKGLEHFSNASFEAMVMLAWTAIYFGYHYYESFQEEKERALKATALAHQAQLKMLRYQLNPHFLFNTLNAISTLVLEGARMEANDMLTRLSSFLRYTLANQPSQRVSLEQELYTLGLYLDIEKVRFQDRLIISYDIQEIVKDVLVPSLILQPLIENSIKYAIAPSEDGGEINICAEAASRDFIRIVLKDSGPGIADIDDIKSVSGSGVGLANTRERLQQLYGSSHQFLIENQMPQGLAITLEIPADRPAKTSVGLQGRIGNRIR